MLLVVRDHSCRYIRPTECNGSSCTLYCVCVTLITVTVSKGFTGLAKPKVMWLGTLYDESKNTAKQPVE